MADDLEKKLEPLKAASFAQVLMKTARLMNDVGVARVRASTGVPLRPAHTSLFPHIDLDGSRITTIAARLGVTKQAVAQLVAELVQMEMLEKVPDPADGRAKLVRFSSAPGRSLLDGMRHLMTLDSELARDVGPDRLADCLGTLTQVQTWLLERADAGSEDRDQEQDGDEDDHGDRHGP